jgi:nucleoside-diphosphate-sugar epimerase
MKLVIAGASGFIGSMLVERLLERHDALKLLTRKPHLGSRASRKE